MIMADVLTWFLLILGALMVFIAHWLGAYGLFPSLVEGAADRYARRPVAATFLGLAVVLPLLLIGAAVAQVGHPLLNFIMLLILTVPALLALLGSGGLALRVGLGLASASDIGQPWRRVLRGGMVLALVFLLPIIGWLVVMPWALVSGVGTALMAMRGRRPASGLVAGLSAGPAASEATVPTLLSNGPSA